MEKLASEDAKYLKQAVGEQYFDYSSTYGHRVVDV